MDQQPATNTDITPEIENKIAATLPLDLQQQAWVDYKALSGLIFDPDQLDSQGDFKLRKMPIEEFAQKIGIDRSTLWRWQSTIPGFWERVNQRRTELAPTSRLAKVHEQWFLKAAQVSNWAITDAWLRNFDPNYKEAHAKETESATKSLLDVLEIARTTHRQLIEGEVTNEQ